jgi:transposase
MSAAPARGPDMRMTAIAAGPRPEDRAKMVALIAVARKLLTILNAILRDKRPWQNA